MPCMHDEMLFVVEQAKAVKVKRHGLEELGLQERQHLQEWVLANPDIIGPDTMIITSEFDRWQAADGSPVADRLDVLALDSDGRLVVVELKRGAAPSTVHMQTINYAAMVSRLTPEDVADMYAAAHASAGLPIAPTAALELLTTQHLLSVDGIRNPRLVVIASDFPPSVTAAVVWLNEQNVDFTLIRFRTYCVDDRVVVSFSRLYPVPDVEEFTIGRRADGAPKQAQEGPPWDEDSLLRLRDCANPATLAMLDLCAAEDAEVGVKQIAVAAGTTEAGVRGQLAGLTMRLKNPKYGFGQTDWPTSVTWDAGGYATYHLNPQLAETWRHIRGDDLTQPGIEPDTAGAPS